MQTTSKQKTEITISYNTFYQFLHSRWLLPLLGKGYKKDLEIEDIYENLKTDGSEKLGTELLRYFF